MAAGRAAERAAFEEALKVGGTIANDVGEVLPYVAATYAVIKVIVELAQAARAMHDTCKQLAKQAAGIESVLLDYFGSQGEKFKSGNDRAQHGRLLECLADLTSALESTCSLVKKFSSADRWNEKVWRVVMAKNYQGEFQTCSDKLDKLEAHLSRIASFKIAFCQELFEQAHEQRHQQLLGAIEKDKIKDRPKLEEQLESGPEKSAVLQMHGIRVDLHKPYTDASNSGGLSTGPTKTEPWYVDVSFIRKEIDKWNQHIQLGSGGFGTVFKGTCFGLKVAIKEVPAQTLDALIELKNEIDTMWRLTHANIIQTRGGFYPLENDAQHSRMSFILLEYAAKGSLDKHMFRKCIQGVLPQTQLLDIFSGIVNGLKYLHSAKVIHRDVKPQNILLTEDYTAKISDFGLAREQQTGACAPTRGVGTYAYMAPEVMRGDDYDRTCDVWSFGVMLYEMVLGEHMFGSSTPVEIDMTLRDPTKGVPWHRLKNSVYAAAWPTWLVNTAEACLKINARERPSMAEISMTFRKQQACSPVAASSSASAQGEFSASQQKVEEEMPTPFSSVTVDTTGASASSSGASRNRMMRNGSASSGPKSKNADTMTPTELLAAGFECERLGNMTQAFTFVSRAAEGGFAEAQMLMGEIWRDRSYGMGQDLERAWTYFCMAGMQGHVRAMIEVGRMLEEGRGIVQNLPLAKQWFAAAALRRDTFAQQCEEALERVEYKLLQLEVDEQALRERVATAIAAAEAHCNAIFAVTNSIEQDVQAAQANKESCAWLAKRASRIKSVLLDYFGPNGEKLVLKTYESTLRSLIDCLSDLESELQATSSIVKKFSTTENSFEKVLHALRAKNYVGEFQTCGNRLIELESRLLKIITAKIAHDQNQDHQELMRALEEDRVSDGLMLERELRELPERIAVLQMHSMSADIPNPHFHASYSVGGGSAQPHLIEPWFIDVADVEKEERTIGKKRKFIELGTSRFGTVFRGTCMGETVAIKQVNISSDTAIQEFKNELGMMWRASHENIIRTHGGFYPLEGVDDHVGEVPLILLEYAPKGSLENYMFADMKKTLLPKDVLLSIFGGVLDGLKYLHASKVVHRDLKPQNILLMDDWTPKIGDFGLATVKNTSSFAGTMLGTSGYMAPEVICGYQYNRSCDVWSYGVMLFEMMLGEQMFESKYSVVQILKILEDPKRGVPWDRLNKSEYANKWPDWVMKVARACLQTTPEKRPTVSDIWLDFYDRMGVEGVPVAAKSQTSQHGASSSGTSTIKVDTLAAENSHATVVSGRPAASSSSGGGSAAEPSGSSPVQAQAQSADDMLHCAEEWEKAGYMAYAYEYFKLAAQAGVAEGQFRLGKILLEGSHGMSQHLEHGAGWVRAAAEQENTDAMIEYGRCHHSGRGVPHNWGLAKEWYAKAATLGSSAGSEWLKALETEEQMALRREQLENEKKKAERDREAYEHAAAILQAAAYDLTCLEKEAQDLAEQARRNAADWQERGRTEEFSNKNFTEGVVWYLKAAHLGDAYSQWRLGYFYHEGLGGLRQDDSVAVEWYRKAAKQGHAAAQYSLGNCHENGLGGLPTDKRVAVEWYIKAAECEFAEAQHSLGNCHEFGWGGLPKDKRAAVEWYRKAAEQGHAAAQNNLGNSYASGWGGLPQDKCTAVDWHRKAAEQGFAMAQNNVGWSYEFGEGGLPQDKRAAVEWYTKAAKQGDAGAQNNLKRLGH